MKMIWNPAVYTHKGNYIIYGSHKHKDTNNDYIMILI